MGRDVFKTIASFIVEVNDWKAFLNMCTTTKQWLSKSRPPLLINSLTRSWRGQYTSVPDTQPGFPVLEIWFRDKTIKYFHQQTSIDVYPANDLCLKRPFFVVVYAKSVQDICEDTVKRMRETLPTEEFALDRTDTLKYYAVFQNSKQMDAICNELARVAEIFDLYEDVARKRQKVEPEEEVDDPAHEWWLA
jgi:hypothetical protein